MQIVETTGLPVSKKKETHSNKRDLRDRMGGRDPLYLFACLLEWKHSGKLEAYQELIAALDDPQEEIRVLAECLLQRSSPRPHGHTLCAK
jgi:hypothetical protein